MGVSWHFSENAMYYWKTVLQNSLQKHSVCSSKLTDRLIPLMHWKYLLHSLQEALLPLAQAEVSVTTVSRAQQDKESTFSYLQHLYCNCCLPHPAQCLHILTPGVAFTVSSLQIVNLNFVPCIRTFIFQSDSSFYYLTVKYNIWGLMVRLLRAISKLWITESISF